MAPGYLAGILDGVNPAPGVGPSLNESVKALVQPLAKVRKAGYQHQPQTPASFLAMGPLGCAWSLRLLDLGLSESRRKNSCRV